MSSFSSVIRKPGGKVAPKVAPRRNIVRKPIQAVQPQSPPLSGPPPTLDDPSHILQIAPIVNPAQIAQSPPDLQQGTTPELRRTDVVDGEHQLPSYASSSQQIDKSSPQRLVDTQLPQTLAPSEQNGHSTTTESSSWPSQKSKPQRNAPALPSKGRSSKRQDRPPAVSEPVSDTAVTDTRNIISSPLLQPVENTALPTQTRPTSRRKQPPRGSVGLMLAQATETALPTPPETQPPSSPHGTRAPSSISQRATSVASHQSQSRSEAEEALERVNIGLRKINELAANIEAATRASRSRSRAQQPVEKEDGQDGARPRKRRKTKNAGSDEIHAQAAEILANATSASEHPPTRGRRRNRTPDDPESHQIEPQTTTMGDLLSVRHKWGKKSDKEKEIEANWPEILRRRKADAEARLAVAIEGRRKKAGGTDNSIDDTSQADAAQGDAAVVPDLAIENGKIVAINRERDLQAHTQKVADADEGKVLEDQDIYKRVNQTTIGSRQTIPPGQRWDDLSTETFYQGLKMFGTDFKMISNMIPGKNRKQVKLKYNVEERVNLSRIKRCLDQKEDVNLDQYAEITGMTMVNFADVYKEMEEDEKRLREEDEARRREEGIISQDHPLENTDGEADVAIPSIEGPDGEPVPIPDGTVLTVADRQSTAGVSRLGSTTTGRQTAQPTGRKKQTKKASSAATSKRGRAAANKNKGFEGVEERLGDVGDVGIPTS